MQQDLSNYRKSYDKQQLLESNCPKHPMKLFEQWFLSADNSDTIEEANAVTLSTIGEDQIPKNRIVLLKKFSKDGFIFYTNYNSEKGKSIQKNNHNCLSFFWPALEQQIIIKGIVTKGDQIKDKRLSEKYKITKEVVSEAYPQITWGGRS